jgi:apolipoprotein D and lipocalin family protein
MAADTVSGQRGQGFPHHDKDIEPCPRDLVKYPGKVATRDEYRLRPDGRIDNDFVFKKRFGEADRRWRGVSTVVPGSGGARWKVQFVWPFSTELVVVHVDDDYHGATLATPDGKLAWVFGREPVMEPARYEALVAKLAAQGVDTSLLRKVPQLPPDA